MSQHTSHTESESVGQYNARIDREFQRRWSRMDIRKWKLIQSTIISFIIAAVGWEMGADPNLLVVGITAVNGVLISDLLAFSESIQVVVDDGHEEGQEGER